MSEKKVTDEELAAIARDVQAEGDYTFHRIQDGYADRVPRAVFIGPEDEPIGIPLDRDRPLVLLISRLAADLMEARAGVNAGSPIWAAPAIVTEIGEGDDGHDIVGLKLYGKDALLPVNLPSEARQIGPHLGRRVTVALLAAPSEEGQSIEEQLLWHRAEVDRLRDLLAAKPRDEAEGRFEVGRETLVVTLRSADAEQKVVERVAEMVTAEATARKIATADARAKKTDDNAKILVRMMRSALLIIDAVTESEKRGEVRVSATMGTRWDDLRKFAADPKVREWLRVADDDKADVAADKGAKQKGWTPESWNTCSKCHGPVEKAGGNVEFFDGDEAHCIECDAPFTVAIAKDGTGSLSESGESDDDEKSEEGAFSVSEYEGHSVERVWAVGETPEAAILAFCRARIGAGLDGEPGPLAVAPGDNRFTWGRHFTCDGTAFKAAGIHVPGGVVLTWWK